MNNQTKIRNRRLVAFTYTWYMCDIFNRLPPPPTHAKNKNKTIQIIARVCKVVAANKHFIKN